MRIIINKNLALNIFVTIIILWCVLVFPPGLYAKSFESFTWITQRDNPEIYNDIERVFTDELQPDNPDKVSPIVPCLFKYIAKVGIFENSCFVLIGYREKTHDSDEYDHFKAFTYDRVQQTKEEIASGEIFYTWSLLGLVFFEPTITPDIVFTYFDGMECEQAKLLSSVTYDQEKQKWVMRVWPDNEPHILIGRAPDPDGGPDYEALYRVADITFDGFEDIAVHARETDQMSGGVKDYTLLYTVDGGISQKIEVQDEDTVQRINSALCEGNNNSTLCK